MKPVHFYLMISFLISSCGQLTHDGEAIDLNNRGIEVMNQGDYEGALMLFREAAAHKRISRDTYSLVQRNIAQCYMTLQMPDSALVHTLAAANSHEPDSYEYLINMADADLISGNSRTAAEKLEKAILMKPNDVAGHNTLGLIYLGEYDPEMYDPERALPHNTKAFEINRDRTTRQVLAKNYYELGNYVRSESLLEQIHQSHPGLHDIAFSLGVVKYKLNKMEEAEMYWNEAIQADTSYIAEIESFKFFESLEIQEE